MMLSFAKTRVGIISLTGAIVLAPILLILYQSLLTAPFFSDDARFSLGAFGYVLQDPEFWRAFRNSLIVAVGMVAIAVPVGGVLAFLIVRTDIPGRRYLEPLILIPMLISPVVLALGYVVAAGPVGFYSVMARNVLGFIPWRVYSPVSIILIAGLIHVPHVYLYVSSALRSLGSDVEEAARTTGAGPFRIARDVSLPMASPGLLFSGILVFFAGVEMFGLVLILGAPSDFQVLATYLFKLTNRSSIPTYELLAAVCVIIILITIPLVMWQRRVLGMGDRFISMRGKGGRRTPMKLGKWRWLGFAVFCLWFFVTSIVPLSGITLRAFVTRWGLRVDLFDVLTLQHFRNLFNDPTLMRGIWNSVGIGIIGGGLAVLCYLAIGLSMHRRNDMWTRFADFVVLIPRAVPGLLAGLAFLWVFLFFPPLTPLRATLFSIWIAYLIVWLPYGTRLISGALLQISPELEEAAGTMGASRGRVLKDVTVPLIRYGLLSSWLLIFIMFEREYATGVYLLTAGTEVVGSLIVSLAESGAMDMVAALSVVNMVLVGIGLALALRFGIRFND